MGLVQLFFIKHFERKGFDAWRFCLSQDHTMVPALFHRPQIDDVVIFIGYLKPQRIDVKSARHSKVRDAELDMAKTHDVEWRVQDRGWAGHNGSLQLMVYISSG
jgi:hypothetical protein